MTHKQHWKYNKEMKQIAWNDNGKSMEIYLIDERKTAEKNQLSEKLTK